MPENNRSNDQSSNVNKGPITQNIMAIREFEGQSKVGNFQEALDDALTQAQNAVPGNDRLIAWKV